MSDALKLFRGPLKTSESAETPPPTGVEAILSDYLDRLTAPMVGVIPWDRRERFRYETLSHLEALVDDQIEEGVDPTLAAYEAIHSYGKPARIANDIINTCYEKAARGPIEKRFGRGNSCAFSAFVLLQGLYVTLLQLRVFLPQMNYYQLPLTPAQVRTYWPEPLPYPDGSPSFFLLVALPLVIPFVGGWITGFNVPVRAGAAVYHALLPLILGSFAIGALLLPMTEGILFALFQLVFWLPVGCACAHVTSMFVRQARAGHLEKGTGVSRAPNAH